MSRFRRVLILCALATMAGLFLVACAPTAITGTLPATSPVSPTETNVLPTVSPEFFVTSNSLWMPVIQKFDNVEMVLVPTGCFKLGSTPVQVEEAYQRCVSRWGNCQRSWFTAESPQQDICFSEPFWIDRYEVTNQQYGSSGKFPGDDIPRDSVSWFDATAFCTLRGGYLPTEAEWQYAARGPDRLVYPWGNTFMGNLLNSCDHNCTMDWRTAEDAEIDDGYATTSPVGSFPGGASWVGALDMSGNLWEWVNSIHRPYPYDATDGREADGNADSTSPRVSFGGAWDLDGDHARLAFRNWNEPSFADYGIGFRCAHPYEGK